MTAGENESPGRKKEERGRALFIGRKIGGKFFQRTPKRSEFA